MGIHVVPDNTVRLDAGVLFGVPRQSWGSWVVPAKDNTVTLSINSLLVTIPDNNLIVNAGGGYLLGDEGLTLKGPALTRNLARLGIYRQGIKHVILTSLGLEHAGGCLREYHLNQTDHLTACFKQAGHYLPGPADRDGNSNGNGCVPMPKLDINSLVVLGVVADHTPPWVEYLEGPHTVVLLRLAGEHIAYLGGLVPTSLHLQDEVVPAYDAHRADTILQKRDVLSQAARKGWLLVFPHSLVVTQHTNRKEQRCEKGQHCEPGAGYLDLTRDGYQFRPIDLQGGA